MDLIIERIHGVCVVVLPFEEIDASNAAQCRRELEPLVETERMLVFDLTEVRFVDSSGLGALLSCLRKVNARRAELKLCGLTGSVRAVFELVRMHRVFDIHATCEAAIRAFAPAEEHRPPA